MFIKDTQQNLPKFLARKPYPNLEGLRNPKRGMRHNPSVAKVRAEKLRI